jgi:hypothetical protein
MKHIVKIAFLSLIAGLTLTSCERNRHTPDPGTEGVPIIFSTLSHDAPVKADDALSEYHEDFGVWGIARYKDETKPDYIPWLVNKENQMCKVTSQGVPETGGYWFSGYTYNFIALAPYDLGTSATLTFTEETATSNDALTLAFSMADKYAASDFAYDLMGAVGEKTVAEAKKAGSQSLVFWHLLAKLRINVIFSGVTNASVTGLRLHNVATERSYSITDINGVFDVNYVTTTDGQTPVTLTLDNTDESTENDMLVGKDKQNRDCQYKELHIIPQSIGDFELDLDFKIGDDVQTNGYKLNLDAAKYTTTDGVKTPVVYLHNQWYNWNITITPKGIGFDVTVTPWEDATDDEFDFE